MHTLTGMSWIGVSLMCETCKFCHNQEPDSYETLSCSGCVQRLLALDKDQVQALHDVCVKKGQVEKAELLEKLLMENTNGRQSKSHFKKRVNGARPARFTGIDKKSSFRPSTKQKVAVY